MPDLLGVTNPVPGYDVSNSSSRTNPNAARLPDNRVQNVPDPSRVSRADGKTERQGADNTLESNPLRYDSNFQTFLQQVRDAPDLASALSKTVAWLRGMASTPGLSQGVAQEMAQLLQLLFMDQEEFQAFFLQQMQAGNRFAGPVFSLLRQAYQSGSSEAMQEAILNFAKRYGDFSSTSHITNTMLALLRQMPDYLPQSWRGRLHDLTAQLENGFQAGARAEALKLLQGEILPYLGTYVERTHDMGRLRTMISLLMLNVARYENGDESGLLAAFRQLSGYGESLAGLNQLDDTALLRLLRDTSFTRAAQSDSFAKQLAQMASYAMQGRYGGEVRDGFQEILRSILLNESVYMPLNHLMIPLEWEGKTLYSEVWVDPDAEEARSGSHKQDQNKIQFLCKLDIQSLGFLEFALAARGDQVELQVYVPDPVSPYGNLVAEDLREILAGHGLVGREVRVQRREKPLTLSQVFPALFEGKRSVNVKV